MIRFGINTIGWSNDEMRELGGDIDFNAVLRQLGGYSGWLVVEAEQDPQKAPPDELVALGYRNLKTSAAAAGLA
jgi:inosose dehydratase/3D-(3,5/4)-trihydroxycyclohexane-1,2-dione acylhydrolase (decyclizing)